VFVPFYLGGLATAELACEDREAAHAHLRDAREVTERTGERFWVAELRRLEAACADTPDATADLLEDARTIAAQQGAQLLFERAQRDATTDRRGADLPAHSQPS
jgi:predicted ATPase